MVSTFYFYFFIFEGLTIFVTCHPPPAEKSCRLVSPTLYINIVYRVNLNKLLQIMTKLRWSNKDNNNKLQSKFHWSLFSISYKFLDRSFTPYKHCNFTGTALWYYHRAWVTCGSTQNLKQPKLAKIAWNTYSKLNVSNELGLGCKVYKCWMPCLRWAATYLFTIFNVFRWIVLKHETEWIVLIKCWYSNQLNSL